MNSHKCHRCTPKRCECSLPNTQLIVPIIEKKKPNIPPRVVKCPDIGKSVTIAGSKCPINKVTSITKLGNKIIVTLNDCTYYEADLSVLDLSSFNLVDKVITKVEVNSETNTLTVTYQDSKTGKTSIEDIKLPEEIYVKAGEFSDKSITFTYNNDETFEVDLDLFYDDVIKDIKTFIDNSITNNDGDIYIAITTKFESLRTDIINLSNTVENNKIKSTELNGSTYTITLDDNSTFQTDFSGLVTADKFVNSGSVLSGNTLRLFFNDSTEVDIDLSSIVVTSNGETILITEGSVTGNTLTLNLSNSTSINVDITNLISDIVNQVTQNIESVVIENATNHVINNILKLGYRINTQDGNYSLTQEDFDGRTLVRMNAATNQTLTITKPDTEDRVGTAVIVRRTGGNVGTLLTFIAGTDVTFNPVDISPLRRIGSSATLVYVGNGVWDVFGELP